MVIPTVGRPSLRAAVASALAQDPAPLEVVVVMDLPRPTDGVAADGVAADDPRVQVLWTGGLAGPSGARMAGVGQARGEIVAFLDDDDEWLPGNLAARLAVYREAAIRVRHPVIACRAEVVGPDDEPHGVHPREGYGGEQPLAEYLFRRRGLRGLGFVLGASTLLCGRDLLAEVPFDVDLALHEDWDWLLRATGRPDCRLTMVADPGVRYRLSPAHGSASRPHGGWWRGVRLADDRWGLTGQARGDYLLGIPAGMAIECGDRRAALRIARMALTGPRARQARPGWVAWGAFAVQMLAPGPLIAMVGRLLGRGPALLRARRR
ncbi:glycosyltransferase family 2 protein [Frankia sp. AiPa1]|nr:glycosyltransferase family 2 protein [Frankia sp. AiPa1]